MSNSETPQDEKLEVNTLFGLSDVSLMSGNLHCLDKVTLMTRLSGPLFCVSLCRRVTELQHEADNV